MKKTLFLLTPLSLIIPVVMGFGLFGTKPEAKAAVATVAINKYGLTSVHMNPQTQKVPRVYSKIYSLDVEKVYFIGPNKELPSKVLRIEIFNNSKKPIRSITAESRLKRDAQISALFGTPGNPIVIKAFQRYNFDFPSHLIYPKVPIRINGIIYLDGTEAGTKLGLEHLRASEKHEKERFKKIKERQKKKDNTDKVKGGTNEN